jgi:hypothetical protein
MFSYKDGDNALHLASLNSHLDVVTYLLSQGASLTAQDNVSTRIIISSFVTFNFMISIIYVLILYSYKIINIWVNTHITTTITINYEMCWVKRINSNINKRKHCILYNTYATCIWLPSHGYTYMIIIFLYIF